MSCYLVTGAAGFIGAAVARRLLHEGHKVVTVDNMSTGIRENIPDGVQINEGDCQDPAIIFSLENIHFDAIIHIAGQSSGEVSFEDPVYDLQTNTQSTLLLLNLAFKTGCKKFIYASTMSIYGDQPDKAITEDASLLPKSFYAVGKLASEHYMRIYQKYGIESTALRLFNVYGPGQNMGNLRQGMASIYLAQALKNKHILVKGDSERFRDFVYIDDIVDAFCVALKKRQPSFNAYNVATGARTTVKDLINKITENLPFEVTVEYSESTPGDQFGIYGDITNITNELNWRPKVSLESGIKKFVDWATATDQNLS